jgi:hypothetical protein
VHRGNSFFTGVDVTQANGVYLENGGKKYPDKRRRNNGFDKCDASLITRGAREDHCLEIAASRMPFGSTLEAGKTG